MFDLVRLHPSDPSDQHQVERLQALWDTIERVMLPGPRVAYKTPFEELIDPIDEQLDVLMAGHFDYVTVHYVTMLQHLRAMVYMVHGDLQHSKKILESALADTGLISANEIQDAKHRRRYVLLAQNTKEALDGCIASSE